MLASNESPYPPIPEVVEAVTSALGGLNRYPDPTNSALRARSPTATACPPTGSRSATARATSCSPPARRCSSPAPRSSTRGRASRLPAPRRRLGRARDRGPARRRAPHDLDAMREEITVATRLVIVCNPNNPTSTALPLERRSRRSSPRSRRHVARDPRRGLLRVQPAARTPTRRSSCSTATRTSCCCARSPRSTASAGLRVGFALCGSEEFRTAVDQVRQPFFCNAAAQAAALEALNHQDEVARRVERNLAERIGLEDGLRGSASSRPSRRPTSSGSTSAARTARRRARRRRGARPARRCWCAPAPRSAAPARCA